MKIFRHRSAVFAILLAGLAIPAHAAPPRILDENDDQLRPANFAQVDAPELPRSISPRTRQPGAVAKPSSAAKSVAGPVSLWGTLIGLGVVFAMFLGARVWLTRHGPAGMRGLPVEALELLGKRTIEPRVSIHVVRCGPKILILGVSPDGVRTLTEITDPVEIDLLSGACRRKEPAGKSSHSFGGLLHQTATESSRGAA